MAKQSFLTGAGKPVNREEFFTLPRIEFLLDEINAVRDGDLSKLVTNKRVALGDRFSMTAPDNRMIGDGIRKGDLVVVQRSGRFQEGDLVAAQLGERLFIRRYFRAASRIRLECANPTPQSMIIDAKTPGFTMLGKVVQIIREL